LSLSDEDSQSQKTLVICVDRDNDVGLKTGINTPIVGKDACLNAASRLAMADPEEADANTIFAAVKQYDELMGKGQECEVVVVAGVFERGVDSDRKIRKEIDSTLKGYPATESVIISDGIEGEELVPIINTLVPVVSVRRVIIKHSKSVEESYAVLGRYFKMLLFDPRYARYALGVPGIIFVGVVLMFFFKVGQYAPLVLVGLIGAAFVIRGFDIDRKVENLRNLTASGYLRLLGTTGAAFIVLAGIIAGVAPFFQSGTGAAAVAQDIIKQGSTAVLNDLPKIVGFFIQYSQLYVWIGFGLYITQSLVYNILRPKSRHITRNLVSLIVLGLLYPPVYYLSRTLLQSASPLDQFVAAVMFTVAASFAIAAYMYHRITKRRELTKAIQL
jgi:putative membrane protein